MSKFFCCFTLISMQTLAGTAMACDPAQDSTCQKYVTVKIPVHASQLPAAEAYFANMNLHASSSDQGRYSILPTSERAVTSPPMPTAVKPDDRIVFTAPTPNAAEKAALVVANYYADLGHVLREVVNQEDGHDRIIISGATDHDRTYYRRRLREHSLNERNTGIGYEKCFELYDQGSFGDASEQCSYILGFQDSNSHTELTVGRSWMRRFDNPATNENPNLRTGFAVGFTYGLTSRPDILKRLPVPFLFLQGEVYLRNTSGNPCASLDATWIPPVEGNVWYFSATIPVESEDIKHCWN